MTITLSDNAWYSNDDRIDSWFHVYIGIRKT